MRDGTRPHRRRPREGSGHHAPLQASVFDLLRWLWAAALVRRTTQDHLRFFQVGAHRLCCHADAGLLSHIVRPASQSPSGVRQPQTAGPPADDLSPLGPILRRDVLGGARARDIFEALDPFSRLALTPVPDGLLMFLDDRRNGGSTHPMFSRQEDHLGSGAQANIFGAPIEAVSHGQFVLTQGSSLDRSHGIHLLPIVYIPKY